jgi:hypothetical protein
MSPKKPGPAGRRSPAPYRVGAGALKPEADPYPDTAEIIAAAVGGGKEAEEDWRAVFQRSAAAGIQIAPPPPSGSSDDDNKMMMMPVEEPYFLQLSSTTTTANSCLNTPTMEYDQGYFAAEFSRHRRTTTALPAATVTSGSLETDQVVDVLVPVVTTESPLFRFPAVRNDFDGIFETWALSSGSPEYAHAPLSVVEGQVCVDDDKPADEKPAETTTDVVKVESYHLSEVMTVSSNNSKAVLAIEEDFKMECTDDSEDLLQPSTALLDWVIDDNISAEADFPITILDGDVEIKTVATAVTAPAAVVYPAPATVVVPSTINAADWNSIQPATVSMVQLFAEPGLAADEDSRLVDFLKQTDIWGLVWFYCSYFMSLFLFLVYAKCCAYWNC